jgi:hypothetical protein
MFMALYKMLVNFKYISQRDLHLFIFLYNGPWTLLTVANPFPRIHQSIHLYAFKITPTPIPVPSMGTPATVAVYNCTSLFSNLTSSPGLNAGMPIYGQPSHRNASPKLQFPQLPTFPWTVKSTSARSSESSFTALSLRACSCASALERVAASSAAILSASPQVQSLHARRRFPTRGAHSGAVLC